MTAIDLNDLKHYSRPLWCVFVHSFEPSIIPCILRAYSVQHVLLPPGQPGRVVVWGYSIWRRKPGYRTYGVSLLEFSKRHSLEPMFFDSQDEAIEQIRKLTTVSVRLLNKIEIERASETKVDQ